MGDTGRFMNLKAFLAVDSFMTPGSGTVSARDTVVTSDTGENGACAISFSVVEFNMFCVSTTEAVLKSLSGCVPALSLYIVHSMFMNKWIRWITFSST